MKKNQKNLENVNATRLGTNINKNHNFELP